MEPGTEPETGPFGYVRYDLSSGALRGEMGLGRLPERKISVKCCVLPALAAYGIPAKNIPGTASLLLPSMRSSTTFAYSRVNKPKVHNEAQGWRPEAVGKNCDTAALEETQVDPSLALRVTKVRL
jgi:hypothetical protein